MSVRCRLVRSDGSTWYIEELRDVGDGFRVDAVPNGDAEAPAGCANGGPSTLDDEPLLRGDRIEWVEDDGEVLWSMRVPMNTRVGEEELRSA